MAKNFAKWSVECQPQYLVEIYSNVVLNCSQCLSDFYMVIIVTAIKRIGWELWSSGYGRRLVFKRSWVQIPAHDTGWTFFTLY